jgi:hypothetical protein
MGFAPLKSTADRRRQTAAKESICFNPIDNFDSMPSALCSMRFSPRASIKQNKDFLSARGV